MAKGIFTQGMCVLLRKPLDLDAVQACLASFPVIARTDEAGDGVDPNSLVIDYRPEVNGRVLVTVCDSPWPDDFGDPQESPEIFVAWSLGQYGPLAFPGCLQRAGEHSWGWEEANEAVTSHQGYIRILSSYVLGVSEEEDELLGDDDPEGDEDTPLIPEDYDPLDELDFLTRIVTALLELPEAICYFNPGGEVLREQEGMRTGLNQAWADDLPALDVWTNVRLFTADSQWSLMDTVGNGQLDLPDLEAVFPSEAYEPAEVAGFLRTASIYLVREGDVIEDGDVADGPGEIAWRAIECDDGLSDPPRPTIRWVPEDGSIPPEALLVTGILEDDGEDADELGGEEFRAGP